MGLAPARAAVNDADRARDRGRRGAHVHPDFRPCRRPAVSALPSFLTPASIEAARRTALLEGTPVMAALEAQSGLAATDLMQQIASLFGYPLLTMDELRGAAPAFEHISYPECMHRNIA